MRKAIPTAPFPPCSCTNHLPAAGRNIFLRLREAEDPEAYPLFGLIGCSLPIAAVLTARPPTSSNLPLPVFPCAFRFATAIFFPGGSASSARLRQPGQQRRIRADLSVGLLGNFAYCTDNVKVVCADWLPDIALTVSIVVPAGVPGLPPSRPAVSPPHPLTANPIIRTKANK